MSVVSINFPFPLNVSVQIGDIAYYANTVQVQQFNTAGYPNITQIGNIINITPWNGTFSQIDVFWNPNPIFSPLPPSGSFIMFSKDNKANLSSALGYYAELKLENNSLDESELFAVNTGVLKCIVHEVRFVLALYIKKLILYFY